MIICYITYIAMHKFLKMAESFAQTHTYDHGLDYSLCAVIVKSGKPISVGFNNRSTNQFVEHYANLARGRRNYCLSTHAEMDAVLKARNSTDLSGCKIYVSRLLKLGGVANARPCPICQDVLKNYGIKRAFYTLSDNEYGVMKPQNLSKDIIVRQ